MADNYTEWMKNTLSLETEDWRKAGDPETDNEDYFHTSAPKIIYQVRFPSRLNKFYLHLVFVILTNHYLMVNF